jgi:hypothetical protein
MNPNPEQLLLDTWKQQAGTWLRIVDAMAEGAEKMRATQLAAASDAHACLLRVEQAVTQARTPLELWTSELTWTIGNVEKSVGYWSDLMEAAAQTQARIATCLREPPAGP